jgi:hypothetical protein
VVPSRSLSSSRKPRKKVKRRGERRSVMGVWARAEAWAALIDGEVIKTRADLARHLGVSRARVSRVLAVHSVHADVREVLRAAEERGRPLQESGWRRIKGLQRQQALQILGSSHPAIR